VEAGADVVVDLLLCGQVGDERCLSAVKVLVKAVFEGANVGDFEIVKIALGAGEENHDLLLPCERLELRLLEEFGQAAAAVELLLGEGVEIGAELREGRELAILGEIELRVDPTCLTALMAAEKPTRETERPTFTPGVRRS